MPAAEIAAIRLWTARVTHGLASSIQRNAGCSECFAIFTTAPIAALMNRGSNEYVDVSIGSIFRPPFPLRLLWRRGFGHHRLILKARIVHLVDALFGRDGLYLRGAEPFAKRLSHRARQRRGGTQRIALRTPHC